MSGDPSRYKEVVPAPVWVWLTLTLTLGLSLFLYLGLREAVHDEAPTVIWVWDLIWVPSIAVIVAVILLLARLEIRVDDAQVLIRFGFVHLIDREIPRKNIERAEAITYRPIRQFGGWGVRRGRLRDKLTGVYSIRGSTGVLVTLAEPMRIAFGTVDQVLIGTMDATRLATHLAGEEHH